MNLPPVIITNTQIVDNRVTQYIIILIYRLFPISNKIPAKIPLTASNSLGSCPMSTFPVEWNNVTTLSRVENIHAMNNT